MGIHLQEVSFAYHIPRRKKAPIHYNLADINLSIDSSDEFIALVGHTGSGKSTLVQLFNGLLLATRGQVEVNKQMIVKNSKLPLKPLRKTVGLVFSFLNIRFSRKRSKRYHVWSQKTLDYKSGGAREVAEVMNITPLLDKSPFNLSEDRCEKYDCGISIQTGCLGP